MKEKLEQELAAWKRRLEANKKNNLQAGIDKAEKEIARLETEISELEAKEQNESVIQPEPIEKKAKKKKAKKGKGVRALLPDIPVKPINKDDPDCQELLRKHRENAKKRREAVKKHAAKPIQTKVVETVEKAGESVEKKVEEMTDKDKELSEDTVKKLKNLTDNLIKTITEAIPDPKVLKEFITGLIENLQKLIK